MGTGLRRAKLLGAEEAQGFCGGRRPRAGGGRWYGPLLPRPAAPLLRAPASARGREDNSGHVTRKRDFVDVYVCRGSAGSLPRRGRELQRAAGFGVADHREAWEAAGEGRRVTGTCSESCPKCVYFPSSSYKVVAGGEAMPLSLSTIDNALEEEG